MRAVFIFILLGSFFDNHGQSNKGELGAFLSKYENGQSIAQESWLIDTNGDTLSYSDLHDKWILIDYWSVTCKPCLKELPALSDFSQTHGITNLEVIGISVDTEMDRWVRLSPKRIGTLPNYYAGRSTKNDLLGLNLSLVEDDGSYDLMTTLPMYSLIDPSGRIMERELKVKPSDSGFAEYIKSLMSK